MLILCRFLLLVSNLKVKFSFRRKLELSYFNGGKLCVYVGGLLIQCKLKCQTTKSFAPSSRLVSLKLHDVMKFLPTRYRRNLKWPEGNLGVKAGIFSLFYFYSKSHFMKDQISFWYGPEIRLHLLQKLVLATKEGKRNRYKKYFWQYDILKTGG